MTSDEQDAARRDVDPAEPQHPFPAPFPIQPTQAPHALQPPQLHQAPPLPQGTTKDHVANGAGSGGWAAPVPPPRRRRGRLFHAAWVAGVVLVLGVLVQGAISGTTFLADAVANSGYQSDESETVLTDSWTVDGVDVVYVEAGGSECESEYCWEWLLMTQPDCNTATVTVEISDSLYGDTEREIEWSIATDGVTSVLVEALPDDGAFADLTSISCD